MTRIHLPAGLTIAAIVLLCLLGVKGAGPAFIALRPLTRSSGNVADSVLTDVDTVVISVDNFTFSPGEVRVKSGTRVTWVNNDDVPHTIASSGKLFMSPPLDTGERFSFRSDADGRYEYFCTLHLQMTGIIVVE